MRSPLNDRPMTRKVPGTFRVQSRRRSALLAVVAVAALVFAGCGSDDGGDESTDSGSSSTTETTAAPTESTEAETTTTGDDSAETTASTAPPEDTTADTTEPTEGQLSPGDSCSIEEGDPDCIDPDGDGEGTYLLGGADCLATAPDPSVCQDLDGDGNAGYPDEYQDLPACSDEVPPPCNNAPGSNEE